MGQSALKSNELDKVWYLCKIGKMQRTYGIYDLSDNQAGLRRRQAPVKGELVIKLLATCRNRKTSEPCDKYMVCMVYSSKTLPQLFTPAIEASFLRCFKILQSP
jgi:hypothetical protein